MTETLCTTAELQPEFKSPFSKKGIFFLLFILPSDPEARFSLFFTSH